MTSDNPFDGDELPPGASVFGDVAPQVGSSVFGNDDLSSGSSVFTDIEPDIEVDEVPIEAIESRKSSVFGDVESPIGFDDSPRIIQDSSPLLGSGLQVEGHVEGDVEGLDLDGADTDEVTLDLRSEVDIDDGSDDPVELSERLGNVSDDQDQGDREQDHGHEEPSQIELSYQDQVPEELEDEPENETAQAETTASHSFDDGIEPGEPIALDIDPDEDDGLEAWSDLGPSSSPVERLGQSSEDQTLAFDDIPEYEEVPAFDDMGELGAEPEREVVKIGSADRGDFFEFDGNSTDHTAAGVGGAAASSDLQPRVVTGAALLAVAIIAFALSPILALALIVVIVTIGAGELFNALRIAGYQPATLLGLAASIAMPLAVYVRGTQAVALIMGLTIVFGLIWYIVGVATEMPVMNLGVTVLGVFYVGGLASFGAAMLENAQRSDLVNDDGTELLLIALILTIAYDIGAYFSGRSMGRTPLTAISPNKTVEGLVGGMAMTVVASVVFVNLLGQFVSPVSDNVTLGEAFILGIAVAIMAPLGDLAESLIKRDLGIKDMGSILPGHGGVLDRVDALLFVLPTVYFFALAFVYA